MNPFDDLVPRAIQPKKPGEAAESGQQTKVQVWQYRIINKEFCNLLNCTTPASHAIVWSL